MTTYVFDYDLIAYKAASACEDTSIKVTFKKTGSEKTFKNREQFYGRKNNIRGWLGEVNSKRTEPLTLDDFIIEDVKVPTDNGTLSRVVTGMVSNMLARLDYNEFQDSYYGYLGKGETFRHDLATLLEYKANRPIKPVLLPVAKQILISKHGATYVTGVEADDIVAQKQAEGYSTWLETQDDADKVVVITVDKDSYGVPGFLYNPDKPDDGIICTAGFGKLHLDSKGKVRGQGYIWKIFQIAYGDPVDNYFSYKHSDKYWGPKSAYDALVGCKDTKEAHKKLVEIYKYLYPEPKTITNWKGDTFEIDWKYVLTECSQLAMMRDAGKVVNIFENIEMDGIDIEAS